MKKRRIIIPLALLTAIAVGVGVMHGAGSDVTQVPQTETVVLQDLKDYIRASGTIESGSETKVRTNLSYPVLSVNVKVGDSVKKGDLLCTIDTQTLRQRIAEQEAVIAATEQNAGYTVTDAEKSYNNALAAFENGENTQLLAAQSSIDNALTALNAATKAYNDTLATGGTERDTQFTNAKMNVSKAQTALSEAESALDRATAAQSNEDYYAIKTLADAYDEAKKLYASSPGGANREALDAAKTAYDKAKAEIDTAHKNAVDAARRNLDNAKLSLESAELTLAAVTDGNDSALEALKSQLENAQKAYDNAVSNYDLTLKSILANIEALRIAAERAKSAGANTTAAVTLQNLYDQLEEATITAPCDGVITFENAIVGIAYTGVLFVIEDPSDLIINVAISEYDIPGIHIGQACEVVPNAMTNLVYDGVITAIEPTAQKSSTGDDAGTANFLATVAVTSKDTDMLIGMTARVNIITAEAPDVLTISADLLQSDSQGSFVYVSVSDGGTYEAKKVYVEVVMETTLHAAITPKTPGEISEGTEILINPPGT
jgi:multidrug efflux pump subunit AcrA (membrane-fusion protein)